MVPGTHIQGMPALRKYQSQDVDKLRETLRQVTRRMLSEASVGYGKSVVIEHLAAAYSAVGRRVGFLSNRSAVVTQLHARAGGMPGEIGIRFCYSKRGAINFPARGGLRGNVAIFHEFSHARIRRSCRESCERHRGSILWGIRFRAARRRIWCKS